MFQFFLSIFFLVQPVEAVLQVPLTVVVGGTGDPGRLGFRAFQKAAWVQDRSNYLPQSARKELMATALRHEAAAGEDIFRAFVEVLWKVARRDGDLTRLFARPEISLLRPFLREFLANTPADEDGTVFSRRYCEAFATTSTGASTGTGDGPPIRQQIQDQVQALLDAPETLAPPRFLQSFPHPPPEGETKNGREEGYWYQERFDGHPDWDSKSNGRVAQLYRPLRMDPDFGDLPPSAYNKKYSTQEPVWHFKPVFLLLYNKIEEQLKTPPKRKRRGGGRGFGGDLAAGFCDAFLGAGGAHGTGAGTPPAVLITTAGEASTTEGAPTAVLITTAGEASTTEGAPTAVLMTTAGEASTTRGAPTAVLMTTAVKITTAEGASTAGEATACPLNRRNCEPIPDTGGSPIRAARARTCRYLDPNLRAERTSSPISIQWILVCSMRERIHCATGVQLLIREIEYRGNNS